jgi:hypothetical protein
MEAERFGYKKAAYPQFGGGWKGAAGALLGPETEPQRPVLQL